MKPFFDQYLRDTRIPTFEYALIEGKLRYRWTNCVKDFNMKLKVYIDEQMHWLEPRPNWQNLKLEEPIQKVIVDEDFYVTYFLSTNIQ